MITAKMNTMQSFEADNILSRISNSLLLRIDQRCAELSILLGRANKQDLQSIFPIIVDNIFGPQGTYSWNLRKLNADTDNAAYINIMNFLKPEGPMFKVIYSLLQDATIKYDFSPTYLPIKVRQMLDGPNPNPFYNEIIQYSNNQNGRQLMSLLLNPFDYYIFHFVHHLINPCHQRISNGETWNTVYYNLSTQYLIHFFPTIPDTPITPSVSFYHGKNPAQSMQQFVKAYKQSTLLKQNLFGDPAVNDMKVMHQHIDKHPRIVIWRSETILVAIIDMWLSNDQVCSQFDSLKMGATYPELPSADYIRIIRAAVKHLHAFSSSANIDNSPLGELKKHTMPMMQSRMYVFLRNLLHRWPLDESFRYVLELWLSFIQPWRYSFDTYNQKDSNGKTSLTQTSKSLDESQSIDTLFTQFIAENLLVYVVILQQLLPRFNRIDLASPKNAYMLYRLTKVFNQRNLVNILRSIESLVENKNYSPTHHSSLNYSSILPPLSPTSRWSTNNTSQIYSSTQIMHDVDTSTDADNSFTNNCTLSSKYMNLVRQKIYELEGPSFCYKPLFTGKPASEVYELLKFIKHSEVRAVTLHEECKAKQRKETGFFSFFFGHQHDVVEFSLTDRQKTPMFLKSSVDALIEIFNAKDFCNMDITPEHVREISVDSSAKQENNFPAILTPTKVKERLMNMKYQGDPDLIPICSFEVAFLVRLFYCFCTKINEQYGDLISQQYYNPGFWGRFVSNFLQEPVHAFKYEKSRGISRRVMYALPPRISMRKFASHSFLLFIAIGCSFTALISYGWWMFLVGYIFAYLIVAFWRATFRRREVPTLSLNLNDSLED